MFQAGADFAGNCLCHAPLISGLGMFSAAMAQYGTRYEKSLAVRSEADAFHSVFGTVIRLLQMTVVVGLCSPPGRLCSLPTTNYRGRDLCRRDHYFTAFLSL